LTTAAQTNITSLGTLTALAVDNFVIDGTTIELTTGDIILDSAGGKLQLSADGTSYFKIIHSSGDTIFKPQINGKDLLFHQYDGTLVATVEDNGTFALNGALTGGVINTPAFSAFISTGQDVPNNTATKVTLGSEKLDTDGKFASSRFTPTVPGTYFLTGAVAYGDATTECRVDCYIYKNGSIIAKGHGFYQSATGSGSANASTVDVADDDDYYEMYTYQNRGQNTFIVANGTHFSGFKLGD
jgi:hypothetical protein